MKEYWSEEVKITKLKEKKIKINRSIEFKCSMVNYYDKKFQKSSS